MKVRRYLLWLVFATSACSGGGSVPGPGPVHPSDAPVSAAPSTEPTTSPTSPATTSAPGSVTATPTAPAQPTGAPTAQPTHASAASPTPAPSPSPVGRPTATPNASPTPVATNPAAASASINVHAQQTGPTISKYLLGGNLVQFYDPTKPGMPAALDAAGFTSARWPGGSQADEYHWQDDTLCGNDGYVDPNASFDSFMTKLAMPAALDIAITLNYGSNHACNGGGDPAEAAAWVAYAKQKNYGIHDWTVGNEVYGSFEYDLHAMKNDPGTYASAVASGFYPQIKAADPNAKVGVVVEGYGNWDPTVLANASYDFVELHWYVQAPGQENDATLLQNGATTISNAVKTVQSELATAGHAGTPIFMGELGSVYANPGKQSQSIVQALFAGMTLGELVRDGVFRATWWTAYGGCSDASTGNFSASLYGWQNFGGYTIFSDGEPEASCPNATPVAANTPLATARAYQVMSKFIHDGETSLGTDVASAYPNVHAYGATQNGGYAVALFNLDESNAANVSIAVDAMTSGSGATLVTYGKAQYDDSRNNVWTGPVTASLGAWTGSIPVVLPPWSMSVLTFPAQMQSSGHRMRRPTR